jgi:hypothetical protein
VQAGERAYAMAVDAFADNRACPIEGLRDVKCGRFAWMPSSLTVYRVAWVAAVSGHLARNRVVMVDLASDDAPVASGTLHGVLVYPGPEAKPGSRPAFAWYVSRLGRSAGLGFADVDADGALDAIYTYEQELAMGVRVVPRDVWTFTDMAPSRVVSAGEKLSGLFVSTFDGVPLTEDGDGWARRGAWRLVTLMAGRPGAIVFERASYPASRAGFDLHVIGDLGDGWREVLSGAAGGGKPRDADAEAGEPEPGDCTPSDVPPELTVGARRMLLDVETACRAAVAAFAANGARGAGGPGAAVRKVLAASRLRASGLSLAASALEESASGDLSAAWPLAWPASAVLSARAAFAGRRALAAAYDARVADPPSSLLDDVAGFPALWPVTRPIDLLAGWARRFL